MALSQFYIDRYESKTWAELEGYQREINLAGTPIDILTITGFMKTDVELVKHTDRYKKYVEEM
jgi:hypothetical protein